MRKKVFWTILCQPSRSNLSSFEISSKMTEFSGEFGSFELMGFVYFYEYTWFRYRSGCFMFEVWLWWKPCVWLFYIHLVGRDPERLIWIRSCVRGGTFFKHPPYWDKPIAISLHILHFISFRHLFEAGLHGRSWTVDPGIPVRRTDDTLEHIEVEEKWIEFKMIVRSRGKTNCFCVVDINKQNVWVWIFFNKRRLLRLEGHFFPFVSKQMIRIQKKDSNPISNAQLEVISLTQSFKLSCSSTINLFYFYRSYSNY